jgi:HemY protein
VVAENWSPVSPVTGRLDAFSWRVPVEPINKREGEVLASKLEELVTLGAPREVMAPRKNAKAKTEQADGPETIEIEPVPTARATAKTGDTSAPPPDAKEKAESNRRSEKAAAFSASSPRLASENAVATLPLRKFRKRPTPTDEPSAFVAPPAPDDPGPEKVNQDDVDPPLRPQRA